MANEKKKINELVSDDDPTSELDVVTFRQNLNKSGDGSSAEADAHTSDFDLLDDGTVSGASIEELNSDLRRRSETVERLQYDIAQLHSKWLGLETEIKAREELAQLGSHELAQQLALAAEVIVEDAYRHACAAGNLGHGRILESGVRGFDQRCLQNPRAGVLGTGIVAPPGQLRFG